MSAAPAFVLTPPSGARVASRASTLGALVARLVVRPALWGAAIGAVLGLSYFAALLPIVLDVPSMVLPAFKRMVADCAAQVGHLAVWLSLAFHFFAPGRTRILATTLAIVLVIALNPILSSGLDAAGFMVWGMVHGTGREHVFYTLWFIAAVGVMIAVYHDNWERARLSAQRLHAAQLDRQRGEHALLESRLNVVRARIDPAFLFHALGEVRRRYGRSTAEAEALLDELITFLRASLPEARERGSTLGEEFRLVESYLHLVAKLRSRPAEVVVRIPEELRNVFHPPMILLPLFEQDIVADVDDAALASIGAVSLLARTEGNRLLIEAEGSRRAADPGHPAVHQLRTTLNAFFGSQALVAVLPRGDAARITIEYRLADAAIGREVA